MDFSNSGFSSAAPTAPILATSTNVERRIPHTEELLAIPSLNRQIGMEHDDTSSCFLTFFSGQYTPLTEALLRKIGGKIYVSAPQFNVKQRTIDPLPNETYNNSCVFGPDIVDSVVKLVRKMTSMGILEGFPCRTPDFALNEFVFKKMSKILAIADKCTEIGLPNVAKRIVAFVEICKKCKSASEFAKIPVEEREKFVCVDSIQVWQKFLKSAGIADNWADKLHFDEVGELFGISATNHKALSELYIDVEDGPPEKLRQFGFRWLSKLVNLYSCDVCITDLVNLVMVYQGKESKNPAEVVEYVNNFTAKLDKHEFIRSLVTFVRHVKDSEADDLMANRLINYVNNVKWGKALNCKSVETIVQLPANPAFNKLADMYVADGCSVIRDDNSQNGEALKNTFRLS